MTANLIGKRDLITIMQKFLPARPKDILPISMWEVENKAQDTIMAQLVGTDDDKIYLITALESPIELKALYWHKN